MKHRIDPKVDCVFKALLGAEENRNLLVHFLNAVLADELSTPISEVEILNPYNEKEFLDDKLSIVDVKAQDQRGQMYQIEIQLASYRSLPARIVYTWADLYSQQLHSGQDYAVLQPTYAIWLLGEPLFPNDPDYVRDFRLRDKRGRAALEAHGGIWLLELDKFAAEQIDSEQQRWLKFFKEGEQLDDAALPGWMQTDEMRQVMSTLKRFFGKRSGLSRLSGAAELLTPATHDSEGAGAGTAGETGGVAAGKGGVARETGGVAAGRGGTGGSRTAESVTRRETGRTRSKGASRVAGYVLSLLKAAHVMAGCTIRHRYRA